MTTLPQGDTHRVVMPDRGRRGGFVAGAIVDDGVVVFTAPILAWSRGQPLEVLDLWVRQRGGYVERLPPEPQEEP